MIRARVLYYLPIICDGTGLFEDATTVFVYGVAAGATVAAVGLISAPVICDGIEEPPPKCGMTTELNLFSQSINIRSIFRILE